MDRKLNDTQWAVVFQARKDWETLKRTSPADTEALDKIAHRVYSVLGLTEPPVYHFDSPLAAMLAIPHLAAAHRTPYTVYPDHSLLKHLQEPLTVALGKTVDDDLQRRLGNQIIDGFDAPVNTLLNGKFLDGFTDRLCGILRSVGGEEFLKDRLAHGLFNPILPGILAWWKVVSGSRCWWWIFTKFLVVSNDPPDILSCWDDNMRIHGQDGAAVRFADGCSVYAIHGVVVPERIVLHPETITVEEIQNQKNAEVRRVMIEKIGPGNYLQKTGAKLIDMDTLTLEGSAPRALMEDMFGNKWLVGTDGSTARVYTMAVPREARTCRAAHEMIAGFGESRLIAEA